MISDDTFVKACHIALKGYLHNELEADADDEAAGNNRTHIAFRKVWKTVAVAAITLTLLQPMVARATSFVITIEGIAIIFGALLAIDIVCLFIGNRRNRDVI